MKNIISPIKWVGGKRKLLPQIMSRLPEKFERYFEPFCGGASVFFAIQSKQSDTQTKLSSIISDTNPELINFFRVLKNNPEELIEELENNQKIYNENPEATFKILQQLDREDSYKKLSSEKRAARFAALNRTGFNGLWRVNSSGFYNTPWNKKVDVDFVCKDKMLAASDALQNADVNLRDYKEVVRESVTRKSDFVYIDPPYYPVIKESFTSYTKDSFGPDEHKILAALLTRLDRVGSKWLLSQSDVEEVHTLYKKFNIEKISSTQAMGAPTNSSKVSELLIRNY
jgi:DNA adenine methylase